MIGKNPVMKDPVQEFVSTVPLKKQVMSPCRVSPAALTQLPSWNHGSELSRWCSPNGMSRRLMAPKTNPVPGLEPWLMMKPPTCLLNSQSKAGYTSAMTTPATIDAAAVTIGTNRRPPKNAR